MAGVRAREASPKNWDPLFISVTVEASNFKFGSFLVHNFYDENWRGSGLGEYPNKFGTPYLFLQPLKLAT